MAAAPVVLNLSPVRSDNFLNKPNLRSAWLPIACSLAFVCFTSSALMGGYHTQKVLDHVWRALLGNWHTDLIGPVNGDSRKIGHFFGYGAIGLLFRRAWHVSIKAWALVAGSNIALYAASLGIVSTFAVASLEDWHQCFLPGRVGSFHDVLLDTCGALCLNLLLFAYRAHKQSQMESVSA